MIISIHFTYPRMDSGLENKPPVSFTKHIGSCCVCYLRLCPRLFYKTYLRFTVHHPKKGLMVIFQMGKLEVYGK